MTGLSVLTIRYYMGLGLLTPQQTGRNWDFSQEDLSRAAAIARYKDCGFSLQAIAALFSLQQDPALSRKERNLRIDCLLEKERRRIRRDEQELAEFRAYYREHYGKDES